MSELCMEEFKTARANGMTISIIHHAALSPCPKCGSNVYVKLTEVEGQCYADIHCDKCSQTLYYSPVKDQNNIYEVLGKIVAEWNKRTVRLLQNKLYRM